MSFKHLKNFYVERGEGICVSQDSRTEYIRFIDFFKAVQGLRSHLAQGVPIIFPLFASFKQLVVTIWNTVLRRILRLSLNSLWAKNAVIDSDICCGRKGPLLLKYHVFHVIDMVCRFLTSAPWIPGRPLNYCNR